MKTIQELTRRLSSTGFQMFKKSQWRVRRYLAMREAWDRITNGPDYWTFDSGGDVEKDNFANASALVRYCGHQIVGWSEIVKPHNIGKRYKI